MGGGELVSTFFSLDFRSILSLKFESFFGSNFFSCALNVLHVVDVFVSGLTSGRLTLRNATFNSTGELFCEPGGSSLVGDTCNDSSVTTRLVGGDEERGGEGGLTLEEREEGGSDLAELHESVEGSLCLRLTPNLKLASSTDGAGVSRSSAGGGGGNSRSGGAARLLWKPPDELLRIILPGCRREEGGGTLFPAEL